MISFTGKQYTQIAMANAFGLDKEIWGNRLKWAHDNENHLESLSQQAKEKPLYIKAVNAWRDAQAGTPTGFIMGMDATASGLQIMATASGCKTTARNVNLVNTGQRMNIYQKIADRMNKMSGVNVDFDTIKHPVMTVFYGSTRQPKKIFGEDTPELQAFYDALYEELPGAMELMGIMQSCWNPNTLEHRWTLPDGHVVKAKVMVTVDRKIEVDELNHATFTHRAQINAPSKKGLSLAANIVHSIDGYIVREMIRRCNQDEFELATIHDSFWAHPNNMNLVRAHYRNILIEIADSNLMQNILREVTGKHDTYNKRSRDLSNLIRKAEYMLS